MPLRYGSVPIWRKETVGTMKGRGAWIWHLLNDKAKGTVGVADSIEAAADRAAACLFDFVLVKIGDNGTPFRNGQFSAAMVAAFHKRGIKVFGWSYDTPKTGGGWRRDFAPLAAMIASSYAMGADGHCIDAEVEWQDPIGDACADDYHAAIAALGLPASFEISHAPFDFIAAHTAFPYTHLTRGCSAVLPQAYWPEHGIPEHASTARMLNSWARYRAQHPELVFDLVPAGYCVRPDSKCADPTAADIASFEATCKTAGCPGVSLWTLDRILPPLEQALKLGSVWRAGNVGA